MIHYPAFRKTIKWYRKLFFAFMDMAVLNASILYTKTSGKKLSLLQFRSQVVYQLIETYAGQRSGNVLTSPVSNPLRLTGRHFPNLYIDKTGKKSRRKCVVCSKIKKKKQTYYECKICNVGLCVDQCFEKYHTLINFS